MKVTVKDVEHIAGLSRLTIPESEMEKFTEQFNQILNYADILEKIDTEGIERTADKQRIPRGCCKTGRIPRGRAEKRACRIQRRL